MVLIVDIDWAIIKVFCFRNAHIVKGLLENVMDEHGRKVHYSPKNIVNLPRHSLIGYQEKGPGNCLRIP